MAQTLTIDREDLKGWNTAAARSNWWMAICAWAQENGVTQLQSITGKSDGTIAAELDPALTEPTLSQFQTEMDTLVSVSGTPGSRVFTHL